MIADSNSKNLLFLHSIIYDKYLRCQIPVLTYRGKDAEKEHKGMFDAVFARDADTAKNLLEDHIRNGLTPTLKVM